MGLAISMQKSNIKQKEIIERKNIHLVREEK